MSVLTNDIVFVPSASYRPHRLPVTSLLAVPSGHEQNSDVPPPGDSASVDDKAHASAGKHVRVKKLWSGALGLAPRRPRRPLSILTRVTAAGQVRSSVQRRPSFARNAQTGPAQHTQQQPNRRRHRPARQSPSSTPPDDVTPDQSPAAVSGGQPSAFGAGRPPTVDAAETPPPQLCPVAHDAATTPVPPPRRQRRRRAGPSASETGKTLVSVPSVEESESGTSGSDVREWKTERNTARDVVVEGQGRKCAVTLVRRPTLTCRPGAASRGSTLVRRGTFSKTGTLPRKPERVRKSRATGCISQTGTDIITAASESPGRTSPPLTSSGSSTELYPVRSEPPAAESSAASAPWAGAWPARPADASGPTKTGPHGQVTPDDAHIGGRHSGRDRDSSSGAVPPSPSLATDTGVARVDPTAGQRRRPDCSTLVSEVSRLQSLSVSSVGIIDQECGVGDTVSIATAPLPPPPLPVKRRPAGSVAQRYRPAPGTDPVPSSLQWQGSSGRGENGHRLPANTGEAERAKTPKACPPVRHHRRRPSCHLAYNSATPEGTGGQDSVVLSSVNSAGHSSIASEKCSGENEQHVSDDLDLKHVLVDADIETISNKLANASVAIKSKHSPVRSNSDIQKHKSKRRLGSEVSLSELVYTRNTLQRVLRRRDLVLRRAKSCPCLTSQEARHPLSQCLFLASRMALSDAALDTFNRPLSDFASVRPAYRQRVSPLITGGKPPCNGRSPWTQPSALTSPAMKSYNDVNDDADSSADILSVSETQSLTDGDGLRRTVIRLRPPSPAPSKNRHISALLEDREEPAWRRLANARRSLREQPVRSADERASPPTETSPQWLRELRARRKETDGDAGTPPGHARPSASDVNGHATSHVHCNGKGSSDRGPEPAADGRRSPWLHRSDSHQSSVITSPRESDAPRVPPPPLLTSRRSPPPPPTAAAGSAAHARPPPPTHASSDSETQRFQLPGAAGSHTVSVRVAPCATSSSGGPAAAASALPQTGSRQIRLGAPSDVTAGSRGHRTGVYLSAPTPEHGRGATSVTINPPGARGTRPSSLPSTSASSSRIGDVSSGVSAPAPAVSRFGISSDTSASSLSSRTIFDSVDDRFESVRRRHGDITNGATSTPASALGDMHRRFGDFDDRSESTRPLKSILKRSSVAEIPVMEPLRDDRPEWVRAAEQRRSRNNVNWHDLEQKKREIRSEIDLLQNRLRNSFGGFGAGLGGGLCGGFDRNVGIGSRFGSGFLSRPQPSADPSKPVVETIHAIHIERESSPGLVITEMTDDDASNHSGLVIEEIFDDDDDEEVITGGVGSPERRSRSPSIDSWRGRVGGTSAVNGDDHRRSATTGEVRWSRSPSELSVATPPPDLLRHAQIAEEPSIPTAGSESGSDVSSSRPWYRRLAAAPVREAASPAAARWRSEVRSPPASPGARSLSSPAWVRSHNPSDGNRSVDGTSYRSSSAARRASPPPPPTSTAAASSDHHQAPSVSDILRNVASLRGGGGDSPRHSPRSSASPQLSDDQRTRPRSESLNPPRTLTQERTRRASPERARGVPVVREGSGSSPPRGSPRPERLRDSGDGAADWEPLPEVSRALREEAVHWREPSRRVPPSAPGQRTGDAARRPKVHREVIEEISVVKPNGTAKSAGRGPVIIRRLYSPAPESTASSTSETRRTDGGGASVAGSGRRRRASPSPVRRRPPEGGERERRERAAYRGADTRGTPELRRRAEEREQRERRRQRTEDEGRPRERCRDKEKRSAVAFGSSRPRSLDIRAAHLAEGSGHRSEQSRADALGLKVESALEKLLTGSPKLSRHEEPQRSGQRVTTPQTPRTPEAKRQKRSDGDARRSKTTTKTTHETHRDAAKKTKTTRMTTHHTTRADVPMVLLETRTSGPLVERRNGVPLASDLARRPIERAGDPKRAATKLTAGGGPGKRNKDGLKKVITTTTTEIITGAGGKQVKERQRSHVQDSKTKRSPRTERSNKAVSAAAVATYLSARRVL